MSAITAHKQNEDWWTDVTHHVIVPATRQLEGHSHRNLLRGQR